jgi:hypothetical protein
LLCRRRGQNARRSRQNAHAKFGSPAWQAANAEGDPEADHCLQENRNCQAKCTNP